MAVAGFIRSHYHARTVPWLGLLNNVAQEMER